MPTGYTAAIKDGIDFKTFAMNCARAFGACVTLRGEAGGGEVIPDRFEPSNYHSEALMMARATAERLRSMGPDEADREAARAWDAAETSRAVRLAEVAELRQKYEQMLAAVLSWEAPTPDHAEFKRFMREQIEQSIEFDCSTKWISTPTERLSGPDWRAKQLGEAVRSIAYHEKEHEAEVRRAADRTAWVKALRNSLRSEGTQEGGAA